MLNTTRTARRLGAALTIATALAAPATIASAQSTETPDPAPYDEAGYWRFTDQMQQRLDGIWNPRADIRARLIARKLVSSPAFVTRPVGHHSHSHAPGWTNQFNGEGGQHVVHDAEIIDGLTYAYRARRELNLPAETVALIQDRVTKVAAGSYWRWPAIKLNQINWYLLTYAADATINGRTRTLAQGANRQINRFIAGAHPHGGAAGNLGPGLRFHYLPTFSLGARQNIDSAEYANITLSFTRFYEQARQAGMARPNASRLRLLRQWITRSMAGYWTHGGYLNWDSGLGFDRWHQGKKLGLVQQALIGISGARELQPNASYGPWAKYVLDRGFELYNRWWLREGGIPEPVRFGLYTVPQGLGSARLTATRMQANAARAIAAGLGRASAQAPPALYSYDPDIGRLAITTPRYNTAIVAVNQGAFPYGGVELARLFDAGQDVAANIGGRAPAVFGLLVRDIEGRQVMASQRGRLAPSGGGRPPLWLTKAPSGVNVHASSRGRAFAGAFSELRASGTSSGGGFHAVTRHRFTPELIDTRWELTGGGSRRVTVDALFPTTGSGARIVAIMRDGTSVALTGQRIALADVERFELRIEHAAYTVTPLQRPRGATAHELRPARQSSAPHPGPTLAIQLARGVRVRKVTFAARVRVG